MGDYRIIKRARNSYNIFYNITRCASAKLWKYKANLELPVPSIIGAEDKRAASVAAFKGIQRSPRGRQQMERARCAHHTHTRDVPPPYPVQRQAFGGDWDGLSARREKRS